MLLVLLIRVLFDPRVFEFEFFPCPNHSKMFNCDKTKFAFKFKIFRKRISRENKKFGQLQIKNMHIKEQDPDRHIKMIQIPYTAVRFNGLLN